MAIDLCGGSWSIFRFQLNSKAGRKNILPACFFNGAPNAISSLLFLPVSIP